MRFDQPPPEPLASAPGFLLAFAGRRIAAEFAAALEPLDMHPRHFGVLNLIAARPGMTQQELGAGAHVDPSSMVAIIDELEERGWAERRPHAHDRRKRVIHLTPEGRRVAARARNAAEQTAARVFESLTEREVETLRRLLRKVAGVER